jgi:hypothetical protein
VRYNAHGVHSGSGAKRVVMGRTRRRRRRRTTTQHLYGLLPRMLSVLLLY